MVLPESGAAASQPPGSYAYEYSDL